MKATEFVKIMGWESTISFLRNDCINPDKVEEIKRLVESHELVESYGGLESAKHEVFKRPSQVVIKQAIADVEACQ